MTTVTHLLVTVCALGAAFVAGTYTGLYLAWSQGWRCQAWARTVFDLHQRVKDLEAKGAGL